MTDNKYKEYFVNIGQNTQQNKEHKLLISHSSKDKKYIDPLITMLKSIGMHKDSIICTSVAGYGVPADTNIYDWLRHQFLNYNLRILYILSNNYYSSPPSLNEMGAAWIIGAEDTLLLLPGFRYKDIRGCIDSRKIGISFESNDFEIKSRLDEFKITLGKEYFLPETDPFAWETTRDLFIKTVRDIAYKNAGMLKNRFKNIRGNCERYFRYIQLHKIIKESEKTNSPNNDSKPLFIYVADGDGILVRLDDLKNII